MGQVEDGWMLKIQAEHIGKVRDRGCRQCDSINSALFDKRFRRVL